MPQTHTVKEGETLVDVAKKYGFASVEPILSHEKNAKLDYRRTPERRLSHPNPNVLGAGEQVFIPDIEKATFPCATGRRHTFVRKKMKDYIPMFLSVWAKDEDGHPYPKKRFRLEIAGEVFTGTTGPKGEIAVGVNPDAEKAELTVWQYPDLPDSALSWELVIKASADEADKVEDETEEKVVLTKPGEEKPADGKPAGGAPGAKGGK
jgi:hypothetical protein